MRVIGLLLLLAAAPPSTLDDPAERRATDAAPTTTAPTDVMASAPPAPTSTTIPPLPWIGLGTGLGIAVGNLGGGALALAFLQRDCDAFNTCAPNPVTILGGVGLHAVVVVAAATGGGALGGLAEDSVEAGAIAGLMGGGATALMAPAGVLVALTRPPTRPPASLVLAAAAGIGVIGGAVGQVMVTPTWTTPASDP